MDPHVTSQLQRQQEREQLERTLLASAVGPALRWVRFLQNLEVRFGGQAKIRCHKVDQIPG